MQRRPHVGEVAWVGLHLLAVRKVGLNVSGHFLSLKDVHRPLVVSVNVEISCQDPVGNVSAVRGNDSEDLMRVLALDIAVVGHVCDIKVHRNLAKLDPSLDLHKKKEITK